MITAAFPAETQSLREASLHCTSSGDALKAFCTRLAWDLNRIAGIRTVRPGGHGDIPELRIHATVVDKQNARVVFSVIANAAGKRRSARQQEVNVSVTDASLDGANAALPMMHPIVTMLDRAR